MRTPPPRLGCASGCVHCRRRLYRAGAGYRAWRPGARPDLARGGCTVGDAHPGRPHAADARGAAGTVGDRGTAASCGRRSGCRHSLVRSRPERAGPRANGPGAPAAAGPLTRGVRNPRGNARASPRAGGPGHPADAGRSASRGAAANARNRITRAESGTSPRGPRSPIGAPRHGPAGEEPGRAGEDLYWFGGGCRTVRPCAFAGSFPLYVRASVVSGMRPRV